MSEGGQEFSFLRIAKVGWRFILLSAFCALIFFLLGWTIIAVLFLVLCAGLMYFFRDPERHPPRIPDAILSPADGRVLSIEDIELNLLYNNEQSEQRRGGGSAKKIVIFMSLFDVHINRSPIDAVVVDRRYRPGSFFTAFSEKASEKNEANFLWLQNGKLKLIVTQIAGVIARRIICPIQIGQELNRGDRIGLIALGSRVEVVLPPEVEIKVRPGQRLRGGESVIALMPPSDNNASQFQQEREV